MEEIIRKWYFRLNFPKEYDDEFNDLLKRRIGECRECSPYEYPMEDDFEVSLLMALYLCEQTERRYEENGYPEGLLDETLQDIVIWTNTCKKVHGTLGLESPKWVLNNHVKLTMFRFGRLQYRQIPKRHLIDMHIPNGGPLTQEEVADSMNKAVAFFKKYFPNDTYKHFMCESWLLDKTVLRFTGENSNIAKFQKQFYTVETKEGIDNALPFIMRWDITKDNLDSFEPENRFQKAVKDYVQQGGMLYLVTGYKDIEEVAAKCTDHAKHKKSTIQPFFGSENG